MYASRVFYHSSYGLSKIIHRHLVLIDAGYGCKKNWAWVNEKAKEKFLNYKQLDLVNTWRLFSCVGGQLDFCGH